MSTAKLPNNAIRRMKPLCPFLIGRILSKKFRGSFMATEYSFIGDGRHMSEHTYKLVISSRGFKGLSEKHYKSSVRAALKDRMQQEKRELDKLSIKTCSRREDVFKLLTAVKSEPLTNSVFPMRVVRLRGPLNKENVADL